MSDEPSREELLAAEGDLLPDLLAFAETTQTDIQPIELSRPGVRPLRFRVRPLLDSEYKECMEKATRYIRDPRFYNRKVADDTDAARLSSLVIYTATVDEDRARLWDNKALWRKLNVVNGPDAVDRLLRAGEKEAVSSKIMEVSGFGTDLEALAKN